MLPGHFRAPDPVAAREIAPHPMRDPQSYPLSWCNRFVTSVHQILANGFLVRFRRDMLAVVVRDVFDRCLQSIRAYVAYNVNLIPLFRPRY